MTTVTTDPSYWLNWRFLSCSIGVLIAMILSAILIWRYECFKDSERDDRRKRAGIVYKNDAWRPYSNKIHPIWLLTYRVIALVILLAVLITNVAKHNIRILYFYYTEWTFTLVTLYFELASIFSVYGCIVFHKEGGGARTIRFDVEKDNSADESCGENDIMFNNTPRSLNLAGESCVRETANVLGYAFQIVFQAHGGRFEFTDVEMGCTLDLSVKSNVASEICAGSVVLTDVLFWAIIYPFLSSKDFKLHWLNVSEHSINAVLLLVDVCFNSLYFPFFRVVYFVLWTAAYVVFQWIFHAFVPTRWPYAFLDLSTKYAPLWYLAIGLLTLPCFYVFALIVKIKKWCWSRILPKSSLNLKS